MSIRFHRGVVWLPLSLLLGACMPSSVTVLPDPTDDAELISAGNGVLVVQVADTTPYGVGVPVNQLTLAPKDVNEDDDSKFPRLTAVEDAPGSSSKLFYAVLPANEYSLSSLRAYHSFGDSYFSQFYPADIALGTFTVEPGKVTDLGVLAVYIRRSGEDYLFETVRAAGQSRALQLLTERIPGLSARIENRDAPLSWHADAGDRDRRGKYISAVNRQIVYGEPYIDNASGIVRLPSRLGVIVQRDNLGEWTLDAVPRDVELQRIVSIGTSDVVITEFGDLLVRDAGAEDWRSEKPPVEDSSLVFVGKHPATGIYAVTQAANAATIWSTPEFGAEWAELTSIERKLGFFEALDKNLLSIDRGLTGATYAAHGDYLYLALGKDMYRFDLRTRQYDALDSPNPESVQLRNGILTIRTGNVFSGSRVSFDNGANWARYSGKMHDERIERNIESRRLKQLYEQQLRRARFLGHPIFVNHERGFGIHEPLKKDEDPFLVETDNGSESWHARTRTTLPEGCGRLVLATERELLLSCFLTGEFYRSTDNGESWQLDRQVSES